MMKKIMILLLALLALVAVTACEDDVCNHKHRTNTTYKPDCSLEGYVLHVCNDCGYSYKSDYTEPKGHILVETVVAPTCTEAGYTHYECDCGYAYDTAFVAPVGHTYTSRITEPTCTEEGYTAYTCGTCEYEYHAKRTIPNGHNIVTLTVSATCTEVGYTLHKCNNCEYSYKTDFTYFSHALVETVHAPTCNELGYTEHKCNNCEYSYYTDFVSPAHTFVSAKHMPSIGTTGYVSHECSVCQYSYESDFVWYSDVFSGAAGEGKGILAVGVDLSVYNEKVDFAALKKAGVDFVILRAGTGYSGKDLRFEEYYTAARAVGLDIGCYYYSYATTVEEALKEADDFASYIAGKVFEYPVYFDLEDDSQMDLSQTLLMDMCLAFCNRMIEYGYFPGVYSYHNWIETYLHTEQLLKLYDVWIARYNPHLPDDYYDSLYGMWQYTETGTVGGVKGDVDLNYCYKNYPAIIQKYGFNGYTAED